MAAPLRDKQAILIGNQLRTLGTETTKRLADATVTELVKDTPKDTTYASESWYPTTNAADVNASQRVGFNTAIGGVGRGRNRFTRGFTALVTEVPGRRARRHNAQNLIRAKYTLKDGPIYIINDAYYITYLDHGSSSKAPAGFIFNAVQKARLTANV